MKKIALWRFFCYRYGARTMHLFLLSSPQSLLKNSM